MPEQPVSGKGSGFRPTLGKTPGTADAGGAAPDWWQTIIDLLNQYAGEAAGSDDAATALQAELGRGQLGVAQGKLALEGELGRGQLALGQEQLGASREQFDITQAFLEGQEEFRQQDIVNQRLLEAAGLATGPTGAIQLAYMARGLGAPQEEVASLFQNLPFIQELLHGQNVPGFGLPEQLGGEGRPSGGLGLAGASEAIAAGPVSGAAVKGGVLVPTAAGGAPAPSGRRTASLADLIASTKAGGAKGSAGAAPSGAIQGRGLGVTIPGKKSITRQAYGTLSDFEQEFLGALGQSETGQSAAGFLQDIIKSFIPTRAAGAVSIA